jgi:hypothetical protein
MELGTCNFQMKASYVYQQTITMATTPNPRPAWLPSNVGLLPSPEVETEEDEMKARRRRSRAFVFGEMMRWVGALPAHMVGPTFRRGGREPGGDGPCEMQTGASSPGPSLPTRYAFLFSTYYDFKDQYEYREIKMYQ